MIDRQHDSPVGRTHAGRGDAPGSGLPGRGWNGATRWRRTSIPIDDYGTRNLVLIDGRSVYSTSYLGDTHRGMMDVMLEDIERIEVLRGATSAAYGAECHVRRHQHHHSPQCRDGGR